jgi:hypothetical protein
MNGGEINPAEFVLTNTSVLYALEEPETRLLLSSNKVYSITFIPDDSRLRGSGPNANTNYLMNKAITSHLQEVGWLSAIRK